MAPGVFAGAVPLPVCAPCPALPAPAPVPEVAEVLPDPAPVPGEPAPVVLSFAPLVPLAPTPVLVPAALFSPASPELVVGVVISGLGVVVPELSVTTVPEVVSVRSVSSAWLHAVTRNAVASIRSAVFIFVFSVFEQLLVY